MQDPADSSPRRRLGQLLDAHGESPPLDLAAALMAADEVSGLEPLDVLGSLDALAARLHVPEGASVFEGVARLSHALFGEHGFRGDTETYDDPRNSLLHQVIERRTGLPILLSLVTMEVGRRVGVELVGIGFPGHFIVAPAQAEDRFFIDPFHGGKVLRPEHLEARLRQLHPEVRVGAADMARFTAPVSPRAMLVRMNQNLKASYVRRRDARGVLRAVQRLQLLEPLHADHVRDEGLLLAELSEARAAAARLEAYLTLRPQSPQREALRNLIDELRDEGDSDESDR